MALGDGSLFDYRPPLSGQTGLSYALRHWRIYGFSLALFLAGLGLIGWWRSKRKLAR